MAKPSVPALSVNVYILERCPLFVQGLVTALSRSSKGSAKVVNTFGSLSVISESDISTQPSLLIIGPHVPTAEGLATCRWIQAQPADIRVIFISRHADAPDVRIDAAYVGVRALLDLEVDVTEFLDVVRLVWRGHTLLPPVSPTAAIDCLNECQLRVLRLMAQDLSYKEIAATLNIGVNTVRNEAQRIFEKLNVHSRQEAVHRARHRGLI